MSQRYRVRGSSSQFVWFNGTMARFVEATGVQYSSGPSASIRLHTGFPYETMYDTSDSPTHENNVEHSLDDRVVPDGNITVRGPRYFSMGRWEYAEFTYRIPPSLFNGVSTHITDLSGLKALAIGRVPAYGDQQMEAFVSLVEAREAVDLTAVKAAGALAGFAANAYRSIRGGGGLKRLLSRDAKRALERLRRRLKKADDAKGLWLEFLAGIQTLSGFEMEWKYGIAPMLSDMKAANAAVDKLNALASDLVKGKRVYGRASRTYTANGIAKVDCGSAGALGGVGDFEYSYSKVTRYDAVASIVRKLKPEQNVCDVDWFTKLDIVAEINGIKPSLNGIWATLPLSFVIDWFFNIGDLLTSLGTLKSPDASAFMSADPLFSLKRETTVTGSGQFAKAIHPTSYECSAVLKHYKRNIDPLSGGPVLYVPPLTLPTKAGQWFSMAQIAFSTFVETGR